MRILGISDGPDAGAALAVDDRIVAFEAQAGFDRRPRSRQFPWEAIADVLRQQSLSPADIDVIAVAGRFSPPLVVRKHPSVRRVVGGPFSGALDVGVFYQAMLRQTGWGAYQADLAAEWLHGRFQSRGFRARVDLIDIHTALANAAYRTQSDDDLLVITLHPMGDGVALAVHAANLGQIDRLFEQRGFASLHVHLERCAAALGCADTRAMWRAAGPEVDREVVGALHARLRAQNGRLSRNRYPLKERSPAFSMLRALPRDVGAASVVENLCRTVVELVREHVDRTGKRDLALAGEVFHNARVVAAVAGIEGVRSVRCPALPGFGALAMGAAGYAAGLAAQPLRREADPRCDELGRAEGQPFDASRAAKVLADGGKVLWWRPGQATRSVLSRADRGPPSGRRVLWLQTPEDGEIVLEEALRGALVNGSAATQVDERFAERYPAGVGSDGRMRVMPAEEPELQAVLAALRASTGCGAVCVEPLMGGSVPVTGAERALGQARRQGIELVCMGEWQMRVR